jgi:tRNA A-37 threonylcarbamoyl transferase component Bud32
MKVFVKSLQGYAAEEVRLTFQHAVEVWQAVSEHPSGRSPRPLHHDGENIVYEFLDLPHSLLDLVRDEHSTTVFGALSSAGAILGHIHAVKTVPKLLHGDYVVHNLFHYDDILYVIDAHPPETLGYRTTLLYGMPARDILAFVTALVSGLGYRTAWHQRDRVDAYMNEFAQGYRTQTALPAVSLREVASLVLDTMRMRYRAGFGMISALLHSACAAAWIVRFCHLVRIAKKQ